MEIKASDLRVGNYIDYCGKVSKCSIQTIYAISKVVQPSKVYQPIPLTEQWLIDFGFEKKTKTFVKNKISIKEQQKGYFFYLGSQVKSVHRIQNLHHSLTGKELTK